MTTKEQRMINQKKVYDALKKEYSEKRKGVTSYHIWRKYFLHIDGEPDHSLDDILKGESKEYEYTLGEYIYEMSREMVTGHLTSLVRQKKVIREMVIEEYEWEGNVYQYSVNKYRVNENAD